MQTLHNLVAKELQAVDQLIIEQLRGSIPLIEQVAHYLISAGGKRLRPLLALLAGALVNKPDKAHISLAAIVEFIHTATLLHDDVVDGAALRRGKPTANHQWDNSSSVLVGDFLYTRAFQLLIAMDNRQVTTLLAETTNTLATGELRQISKIGDLHTGEQDYLQTITDKTAVLFAAAAASGVMLAGGSQTQIDAMYQYGLQLGIAFQIMDDMLDYQGDTQEMGKPLGEDLAQGKLTLPLIYTLQHSDPQQRQLISAALGQQQGEAVDAVQQAVQTSGALDYSRQQAQQFVDKALKHLHHFPATPHKTALKKLATFAITRRY